jgi:antitoxin ChpS
MPVPKRKSGGQHKTADRTGHYVEHVMAPGAFTSETALKRSGGSLIVRVPASIRDALGLHAEQPVTLSVEGERLVVEAKRDRPKYALDDLLARCDGAASRSREERDWHDAEPKGREIW